MTRLYRLLLSFLFICGVAPVSFSQNISSITPSNANIGQTLTVSISGQSTSFGQGTSTTNVWFSQGTSTLIYPVSSTVINAGQVDANFLFTNSLTAGLYDVNVLNSIDGLLSVPSVFTLNPNPNPPAIASANPSTGIGGQSLTVTITGQYTNFAQGTTTANVWFSQGTSTLIYPNNITVVNDTKINANFAIPMNALWGNYDVNTNDDLDGNLLLASGFQISGCTFPITPNTTNAACNSASNGSATVSPAGGTAPFTYSWSPGGQNTQTITGLNAGNYSVTVTDANGCSTTTLITITQPIALAAITSSTPDTCGDGTATVNVSGGTPPYSYLWNPSGQGQTATGLGAGSYTAAVTDANGCIATQTVNVTSHPITAVISGASSTICQGDSISLTASGGVNYLWSTGIGIPVVTVTPTSTTTYSVIVSKNTCSDTASTTVSVHNLNANLTLVEDSINPLVWYLQPTINGTAPFNYLWDFGDGSTSTLSSPSHNYAVAGHYAICLTVSDAGGCSVNTCDSTYKINSGIIQNLIVLSTLTSVEENSSLINSVFPNPAGTNVTISLNRVLKGKLLMSDVTGRNVYEENVNADYISVDVSRLSPGCYTMVIVSGGRMTREKIMIAR